MGKFNYDRASAVLVEAAYFGDKTASERYGISIRSIENYRARLEDDMELVAFFAIKKQKFEDDWAEELPVAIRSSIRYIAKAASEASTDHQMVYSIAGALKILSDVKLTKDVLDARLAENGRPKTEANRPLASEQ